MEVFGSAWSELRLGFFSLHITSHHLLVPLGCIVCFFFRMTAKIISEFFIKETMTECMFVEPKHSPQPVTIW